MVYALGLLTGLLSIASSVYGISIDEIRNNRKEVTSMKSAKGRYIVEYDGSALNKRDLTSSLSSTLSSGGYEVSVNSEFDSSLFSGLSISVANSNVSTLQDLKDTAGVLDAWPASYITLDDNIQSADFPEWNPHAITGVDKLHDRGITGKGVTIAVIDTGVDYNHPALGGGIGPDKPIIKGYDFSEDPQNPSDDPMDCAGHGTFVSSVIVGSGNLNGVAPDAKIVLYKVFPCSDTTTDDIIMAGMIKAYEDGNDIISLSLGSNRGYNTIPIARLASKIAQDIPIMFAAGNSGESGPFFASSGGSGQDVLAIASTHATELVAWKARAISSNNETFEFGYVGNDGGKIRLNGKYKAVVTDQNACILADTIAQNDDEVLIARLGNCYIGNTFNNIAGLGFTTALLYPPTDSTPLEYFAFGHDSTLQDLVEVTYEFGQWAINQTEAGNEVTLEFDEDTTAFALDKGILAAGQLDYFTSWGPTFENNYYPHLAAPGGQVFGASIGGAYSTGSGTSFSCPYVAGVSALYLSENPGTSPSELRSKLITSSEELGVYVNSENLAGADFSTLNESVHAPSIQQGAGLINALKLFDQGTKITSKPFLELNDTVNRVEEFEITIQNDNSESVTYQLSHEAAVTINSRDENWDVAYYYPPYVVSPAIVSFSQSSLTLAPGSSGSVTVTIKAPADADTNLGPVFSGKVWFTGDNGDSVGVPYMGVEVNTYDWTTWSSRPIALYYDSSNGYLYNMTEEVLGNLTFDPANGESPELYFNARYGTELMSFEIVDEDYDLSTFKHPPVAGENGFHGPILSEPDVYGDTIAFPYEYPVRDNGWGFIHFQSYANGTFIQSGRFRLLCRTLRMFGDRDKLEDWQLFLSDPFTVVHEDNSSSEVSSSSETSSSSSASSSNSASRTSSGSSSSSTSSTRSSTGSAPTSTLDGVDAITAITIRDFDTLSDNAFVDDWFEISVTIDKEILTPGTVTKIDVSQFQDITDYFSLQSSGNRIAVVTTFEGLMSITWDDWTGWNRNIKGTYTFTAHLTEDAKASITGPGEHEFQFVTSGNTFSDTVDFVNKGDVPTRDSFFDGERFHWIVDVPGSLGSWSSVTFDTVTNSDEYSFSCGDTSVVIGTDLNEFGNATSSRDAADWTSTSCQFKLFNYVYSEPVGSDEVLRAHFIADRDSEYGSIANTITVTVVIDGESKTYTLDDSIHRYDLANGEYFDGERYESTEEPTTTTSSSSSSSSVVSSSSSSSSSSSAASSSTEVASSSSASSSAPTSTLVLSGIDAITKITIQDFDTLSDNAFVDDWFEISVTIDKEILTPGTVTKIDVSQFQDITDYFSLQSSGNRIGVVTTFDGIMTITWDDWTGWNRNIKGTFTFTAHLTEETKASITGPGLHEFQFVTSGNNFADTVEFVNKGEVPSRNSFFDGERFHWIVDVPGSLGSWSSVTFDSVTNSDEYSFSCGDSTVVIGTELDNFGNATSSREAADWTSTSCQFKLFNYVYSEPVGSDEVLRAHFIADRDSEYGSIPNTITVTVVIDGQSTTYTLDDTLHRYDLANGEYFDGERYESTEEPTTTTTSSSSSSSSVISSTSSEVSSSSSAEVSSSASSAQASSTNDVSSVESSVESSAPATSAESSSVESSSQQVSSSSDAASSAQESSSAQAPSSSDVASSAQESSSAASSTSSVSSASSSNAESSVASSSVSESSSASLASSSESESASSTLEPTISGFYENGSPRWEVFIPGSLGPWTNVDVESTSDDSFAFGNVTYEVDGTVYTAEATFTTDLFSAAGITINIGGQTLSGSVFTINVRLQITTPETRRFGKRAVLDFNLSNTITADASSSASATSSAAPSSSSVAPSSSAAPSSAQSSAQSSAPSSAASSAAASSDVASSVASSAVSSDAASSASSAADSSAASSASSGVASSASSDVASSSASSEIASSTASSTGSVSASAPISSAVVSSGASSVNSDSITVAPTGISTVTEGEVGTTVVTITSCHDNACSETAVTTGVTVVTTTIEGTVTEYTTYCPLPTSTVTKDEQSTTVVTITSCHENACSETAVTTGVTVITTTIEGTVTEYTTYCPLTTDAASTTATGTVTKAPQPTTSTVTKGQQSTTVVTITSCHDNACSEAVVTTGVTVVTETVETGVTVYTTYCPLTTEGVATTGATSEAQKTVTKATSTTSVQGPGTTVTGTVTHGSEGTTTKQQQQNSVATPGASRVVQSGIDSEFTAKLSSATQFNAQTGVSVTVLQSATPTQVSGTPYVAESGVSVTTLETATVTKPSGSEPVQTSVVGGNDNGNGNNNNNGNNNGGASAQTDSTQTVQVTQTSLVPGSSPTSAVITTFEGAASRGYQISGLMAILGSLLFL